MLDMYLKYLESEKRCSPKTVDAYKSDLCGFFDDKESDASAENISEIKPSEIREWTLKLMEENHSPRTINRKLSALNGFFKYMIRERIIDSNPVNKIKYPKEKKRIPVFLEEKKLNNYLDITNDVEDNYFAIRNQTIIELLYATGIRREELINIKINDISDNYIKVTGKGRKERLIPLTDNIKIWLQRLIAKRKELIARDDSEYVFLTNKYEKIYPNFVYRIIKNKLATAGFTGKKSPHVLRHTFATHMLNNGADLNSIKTVLGHSSLAATQIYTHTTFEDLKRIHNKTHPRK
ncbi:MAG: tyrosine-type recombinase/integrase [Prevotellaceae bacterium]|jgi:integrase/recombinase XerC|nr:tyrosine-type recombinase/integrase [Prevotellaceae bacterium]